MNERGSFIDLATPMSAIRTTSIGIVHQSLDPELRRRLEEMRRQSQALLTRRPWLRRARFALIAAIVILFVAYLVSLFVR